MSKKLFVLIIAFFLAILYRKSFSAYFSQDDFFHLRYSQANSWKEVSNFFAFSQERGYSFYRPLSREFYNFLMWRFFGLNPFPFHLFQFLVFILILFSFDELLVLLSEKPKFIFLTLFLYGISAIHLGTFYYLSSIQILLALLFILLTLIYFIKEKFGWCLFFFGLSLLCHEVSYLAPFLMVIVGLKIKQKSVLKRTAGFFLLTIIFLGLNLFFIKLPQQANYSPHFSFKGIVNNFFWYLLWGTGIPEHLLDFVGPGLKINPQIIKAYPFSFWIMTTLFLAFFLGISVELLKLIVKKKAIIILKQILFPVGWFLVCSSVFLILPTHRFVYYLISAEFGLSLLFAKILYFPVRKKLFSFSSLFLVFFFLILNINTIKWGENTYWAYNRSRLAEKISRELKLTWPTLPSGAIVIFEDDPSYFSPGEEWGGTAKQAFLALSGSDGLQLLYRDFSLKAYDRQSENLSNNAPIYKFLVRSF